MNLRFALIVDNLIPKYLNEYVDFFDIQNQTKVNISNEKLHRQTSQGVEPLSRNHLSSIYGFHGYYIQKEEMDQNQFYYI